MPTYTQTHQPLALTTALGSDALLLAKVDGIEALSELFHFRLHLLALNPVSFDALLGQSATIRLTVPGSPQRYVNGILSSLQQGHHIQGSQGSATFLEYEAELVPRLWLLGLRAQCRIFQNLSVPDILQQILHNDWALDMQSLLTGTYPPRDYCVQYRETDLAFVSRLMEEEGICYYFQHTEKKHTLILADSGDGHPDLAGESTLIFDAAVGGRRQEGRITMWHKKQSLRSCKVTLRDHSFQLPTSTLEASTPILDKVPVGDVSHMLKHSVTEGGNELLEIYDYPGRYAWRFDGVSSTGTNQPDKVQGLFQENQRVAHLRMEEEATPAIVIDGASLCGHLLPGCKLTLSRHFDGDGAYLLTRLEHTADLTAAYLSDETPAGTLYENHFHAMPAALPYRPPRRTPRPIIAGLQTATVVGPSGNDIFVDKYGRVKVKFHWDRRAPSGPEDSCWLRVAQLWAGKRWGAYFWPRVGHEVVVSFVEGNPDRPLVVGNVYNEQNMPPFALPDNRTLAGIKSFTTTGNPQAEADPLSNYNGLVFNDAQGQEQIELHGEKHIAFFGEKSHLHTVDGWHRLNVNGTHSTHVGTALPIGSGSGGGLLGDSDTTTPPFIHGSKTGKDIGVQIATVCGINQAINLGLFNTLTVGERLNLTINPLGMATDLGWVGGGGVIGGLLATLGATAGGQIDLIMGTLGRINYGSIIAVNRSGPAMIVNNANWAAPGATTATKLEAALIEALAETIAVLATVGVALAAADQYDTKQADWQIITTVAGLTAGIIYLIEMAVAIGNQIAKAKEAATAATLNGSVQALVATADVLGTLFESDHVTLNQAHYTKGTTGEYNEVARVIGAKEVVMLFGGETQNEQSALTLQSGSIQMGTMTPMVGPRTAIGPEAILQMVGPLNVGTAITMRDQNITLSAGPTTSVSITPDEIKLSCGPTASLTLTSSGMTLRIMNTSVNLAPAGLTIRGVEVKMMGIFDYELDTLALKESVLGQAIRDISLATII